MEKTCIIREILDTILEFLLIRDMEMIGRCNAFLQKQILRSRIYLEKIDKFMFLLQKHDEFLSKKFFPEGHFFSRVKNLKEKFLFPCIIVGNHGKKKYFKDGETTIG